MFIRTGDVEFGTLSKKKKRIFRELKIQFSTEAAASKFKVKTKWIKWGFFF